MSALQGLYFTGDFLYVQPQREGLEYAVLSRDSNGAVVSSVEYLSWSGTPGFRAGGGYQLPDPSLALAASFTYLHARTQRTVNATDGSVLLGTLANNPAVQGATSADGDAGLDYAVVDLDARKLIKVGDDLGMTLFGGVRIASLDQSLKTIYSGGMLGGSSDYVSSPINFFGAGITAGGEVNWNVYRGWGLYGRGRLGLVSGRFDSSRTETVGSALFSDTSDPFKSVIPVVEIGAGVGYKGEHFFLSAGYEMIAWINMVSGVGTYNSLGTSLIPMRGDLVLEGLSVRSGFIF